MKKRWAHCKPAETVEWPTPPELYEALNQEFAFNWDPCPIDGTEDALATLFQSWAGRRIFANPPYGPGMERWLERALDAELAVFLIPARTDTRWFHKWVMPFAAEIRFIQGRLKFGKAQTAAPFASMLVIYDRPPLPGQMRVSPLLSSMKAPSNVTLANMPAAIARNGRGNH